MSEVSEFFEAVVSADLSRVRELVAATPSLVKAKDGEGALGGFLGMEIEDMILAIRQGDVGWVRRFLTRLPALAGCRDRSGKPLLQHAEDSGHTEIARLFKEAASRPTRE